MRSFIFIVFFLFWTADVFAYRCGQPRSFEEDYRKSSAVFIGNASSIHETKTGKGLKGYVIVFSVKKFYKREGYALVQDKNNVLSVFTTFLGCPSGQDGCCGGDIKLGEEYIVFAYEENEPCDGYCSPLRFDICKRGITPCSRTNLLEDAQEDIEMLEKMKLYH